MAGQTAIKKSENDLIKMVSETLEDYFKAMNDNNIEGVLNMIHRSSPAQMPTRQMLGQLMNRFKIIYELLGTKYIGFDEDYIYIRVKQKTIKLEGPEFKNNITDSIVALKQDNVIWKIWCLIPLETSFI